MKIGSGKFLAKTENPTISVDKCKQSRYNEFTNVNNVTGVILMNVERISLTDAEWRVMECLWASSPQTGRELVEKLEKQESWSRSTTLTLLRRMETKGAVICDTAVHPNTFRPLIVREDAAVQETEALLERVYKGSLSFLVSSLTKKQTLPKEEIEKLYVILNQLEEGEHD